MVNNVTQKFKSQYLQYVRVWRLLRKPTMTEFKTISKVTAVGLAIIGALGFLIQLVISAIPGV